MLSQVKSRRIQIEASSICQLSCPCCPNTSKAIKGAIGYGFLSPIDFRNLLKINPQISEVQLSNYGEIFLNPKLPEIFKTAYDHNVLLRADTGVNLNTVKDNVLEALVRCNFRSLTVSLDGASNDTYKLYRVNGNFESVIENIKKINYFKRKFRSKYPQLLWQFIVFGYNEHELPNARKLAGELGMGFRPKLSWDSDFSPVQDEDFVRKELGLKAASRAEYKQKMGFSYDYGTCHALWEDPQINWDGKVLGCKRNFWGDFGGNVFQDGLLKAVNNEKIKYARQMLLGRRAPREDIPCSTCDVYSGMRNNGQWLKRGNSRLIYLTGRSVFRFTYRYFNLYRLREYGPKIEKFISRQ